MAMSTVDYVRSKISTSQTDEEVGDIITETETDVLAMCGTTDETNSLVILAAKYAVLAAVLSRAKTTGELAASVKIANGQRQNTTDIDIQRYEAKSQSFINQYVSASAYDFTSPTYFHGFDHHHHRGH